MAEEESSSILGYKYPDILQVIAQQLTQFGIIEPVLSQASPTAHFSSLLSISRDALVKERKAEEIEVRTQLHRHRSSRCYRLSYLLRTGNVKLVNDIKPPN